MVSFIQISIFAHELTSLLDIKVVMSKKDNTEQAILQAAETEFLDKGCTGQNYRNSETGGSDARHVALLLSDKRKTVRAGFSRESGFDGPFLSGYLG